MKKTMNEFDFINDWPESRKDQFSYEGLLAIYNYLTECEEDTVNEMEYDPIAFCCEFTEYKNFEEIKENYGNIETMENLEDKTTVMPLKGTERIIITNF